MYEMFRTTNDTNKLIDLLRAVIQFATLIELMNGKFCSNDVEMNMRCFWKYLSQTLEVFGDFLDSFKTISTLLNGVEMVNKAPEHTNHF